MEKNCFTALLLSIYVAHFLWLNLVGYNANNNSNPSIFWIIGWLILIIKLLKMSDCEVGTCKHFPYIQLGKKPKTYLRVEVT